MKRQDSSKQLFKQDYVTNRKELAQAPRILRALPLEPARSCIHGPGKG